MDDVGARPWGVGVSRDGTKLYTANGPSADVSVVDIASGKVENEIRGRRQPMGHRRGAVRLRRTRESLRDLAWPAAASPNTSTFEVPRAGNQRKVRSPKSCPRFTMSRRDSGKGETPNSTALVSVRPFQGDCVRLLFSSQIPAQGKSARRQT